MKNIHVLPTDKPSRLYLGNNGNFVFGMIQTSIQSRNDDFTNQHLYITSDGQIKEGDWFYDLDTEYLRVKQSWENSHLGFNGKKIILTTDQDLIKDGVQAIDDEFLEWFVKNPSCKFVEVPEYLDSGFSYGYKIIIPKEEPFKHKVEVLSKEEILANRSNAYEFIDFDKQETLEELKKWKKEALIAHEINQKVIAKHERAEWKLQQLYSEEKIDKILQKLEEIKIMINIR